MKIKPYIYIYLLAALILIITSIFLIKIRMRVPESISSISLQDITGEDYSDIHRNAMIVDSFIELNKKAYGDLITIERKSGQLDITLNNTNKLGSDYYNNNNNIKSLKLMESGFEVTDDEKNNIIIAKFLVHKGNFVNVPNDVIMSLMYKAYNK